MNYKGNKLKTVLSLSKKMLVNAEAERWEDVISLQQERNNILSEFFKAPFTDEDKLNNKDNLCEILSINNKLETITTEERKIIKDEVRSVSKGRRAIKMYAQNIE